MFYVFIRLLHCPGDKLLQRCVILRDGRRKKKGPHPQSSKVSKFWWVMYEAKCSDESERERTFLGVPSPGLTVPFSFVIFVR